MSYASGRWYFCMIIRFSTYLVKVSFGDVLSVTALPVTLTTGCFASYALWWMWCFWWERWAVIRVMVSFCGLIGRLLLYLRDIPDVIMAVFLFMHQYYQRCSWLLNSDGAPYLWAPIWAGIVEVASLQFHWTVYSECCEMVGGSFTRVGQLSALICTIKGLVVRMPLSIFVGGGYRSFHRVGRQKGLLLRRHDRICSTVPLRCFAWLWEPLCSASTRISNNRRMLSSPNPY